MTSEVKPIRSKADYKAAVAELGRLWLRNAGRGAIGWTCWQRSSTPMKQNRIQWTRQISWKAIKFRMEQQSLTRKDLEPLIGTRTRVAEVLNRKRNLSIGMIRRLHARLGIPAEILIRPARNRTAA